MKPSIGRIVHFIKDGCHVAAIITKVWNDSLVNLQIFYDDAQSHLHSERYKTSVPLDNGYGEFSWHWPERVD